MRVRIGMAIDRRGIDLISVKEFNDTYNYESIMQFHNIGKGAADLLTEIIQKELKQNNYI
jgi:hypothetical protein